MSFDTPLSTAWPVFLCLGLLLVSLAISRRHFVLPRGWAAVAAAAVFIRLVVIPALTDHVYDGHEADYYDLFLGSRSPTRGGTVMVPGMQWLWWGLGHILPGLSMIPVLLMSLASVASIGLLAGSVGILSRRRAGWAAAMVLVVHPTHALWSSSAYNVMLPHLLGCLALFAVARIATRTGPLGGLPWMAAGAGALMVALRMDTATIAWPLVLIPLAVRPSGVSVSRRLLQLLPAGVVGLVLAGLALWPLLWPGELPGAGERGVSFAINVGLLDYYTPFHSWLGLAVLCAGTVLFLRGQLRLSLILLTFGVGHHLLLSTFDDFGTRHTLPTLLYVVWCLGASVVIAPRVGWVLVFVSILLGASAVQDDAERFYGKEAAFATVLQQEPWSDLPRVQWPGGVDPACGWVVEDHRVRRGRLASHFNLIRPEEEQSLRGPDGCLRWCMDVQDWRWSSRGVRDRAIRLQHLFDLTPAFVVEEPSTGYACLALDVGQRRIQARSTGPDNERNERAHHSDLSLP